MSSYFVNQLTQCYQPASVGDSAASVAADQQSRDYPQSASPYRGYSTTNNSYPYGGSQASATAQHSPSRQNGDFYMNTTTQRLRHPPLPRDGSSSPGLTLMASSGPGNTTPGRGGGNSPGGYRSPPPPATTNNNNSNSELSRMDSHSEDSHPQEGSPTPGDSSGEGSPPPSGQQSDGATTPTSPSQPQIYPWMRRMHSGHGNGSSQFCNIFYFYSLSSSLIVIVLVAVDVHYRKVAFCSMYVLFGASGWLGFTPMAPSRGYL
jgi:hypothetical protein